MTGALAKYSISIPLNILVSVTSDNDPNFYQVIEQVIGEPLTSMRTHRSLQEMIRRIYI